MERQAEGSDQDGARLVIVGHEDIVGVLSKGLPPVSLFTGPRSVGKWTAAEHLAEVHEILDSDLVTVAKLTAPLVRTVIEFSEVSPVGKARLAIINLDGARVQALYALLKALEESPSYMHYILVSSRAETLPEPVLTRAQHFQFKYLTTDEVEQVLIHKKFSYGAAKTFAQTAGGQLHRVLERRGGNDMKMPVLRAVKAIQERDEETLEALAPKWEEAHTDLMKVWCEEAITQRWRVFSSSESDTQGVGFPLKVYMALQPNVRAKLVVRASLMSLIRER
jgi:hypothetical protein